MQDMKAAYTTGEVAQICGVTLRTVINWIDRGRLKSYKLPGARGDNRITRGSLRAFLEENNLPCPDYLALDSATSKKVLIVDDDEKMASAIARMLKIAGFEVATANDGFEAGVEFERFGPKLVTLDLNMPRLDGLATMAYLKAKSSVKIVVISGEGTDRLAHAREQGADAVFGKPFDQGELLACLEKLLG